MPRDLTKAPTLLRATPARGLSSEHKIDRDGGDFGAGLITGVAVCTKGEALGHDLWLDDEFISQVSKALSKAGKTGLKARFTHPGLSSDGMGKHLGRLKASSVPSEAGVARGDLHFADAAHKTPQGDLAGYVMDLAEEDPSAFGKSIVFERDVEAEAAFMKKNGGDGDDEDYYEPLQGFTTPDAGNARGLRHARLKRLRASDVVDSPAANPSGLFHRGDEIAVEATELFDYVLGLTDELPVSTGEIGLDVHPDRVRGFVARFLSERKLEIRRTDMADESTKPADDENKPNDEAGGTGTEEQNKPADSGSDEAKPAESDKPEEQASTQNPGKKFLDAFGDQGGVWFAQGKTFEQAQQLHTEKLKAENEELKKKLSAVNSGEEKPLSFGVADEKGGSGNNTDAAKLKQNLGESVGSFAAGIKFKNRSKN
jgi:hypothetical protein